MKQLAFFLTIIFCIQTGKAQTTFTLAGTVKDQNQTPLIGASVFIPEIKRGNTSNFNGHYEITELPAGTYQLVVSLLGYRRDTLSIEITDQNLSLEIQMFEEDLTLDNVEIAAEQITERTSVSN
ncbi:MAG: carboxypeptidase-like regulatory domain-containing protein, partial [Bacteroidetes bacterium]|nr:carboxypeptidase-like regulatory domain-containing protein [Bacteroidota bacterium]